MWNIQGMLLKGSYNINDVKLMTEFIEVYSPYTSHIL